MITKEQLDEIQLLVIPLQQWLEKNCDPHHVLSLDTTKFSILNIICSAPRFPNGRETGSKITKNEPSLVNLPL